MKKILTVGTLFVATFVLTSLKTVGAEEKTRETDMQVNFKTATSTKPVDPLDPTNPNPEVPVVPTDPLDPEGTVPEGTTGPLSLDYASNFLFVGNKGGDIEISLEEGTYYSKAQEISIAGVKSNRPNYVQVTDVRGTDAGWQLSVKQESDFTNGTQVLNGATITLSEASVKGIEHVTSLPSDITTSVTLTPNASAPLVKAAKGEGTGTFTYYFGSVSEIDGETDGEKVAINKGVSLHVPAGVSKIVGAYTAKLTWKLEDLPVVP